MARNNLPETNAAVLERLSEASEITKNWSGGGRLSSKLRVMTDNQKIGQKVKAARDLLQGEIAIKLAAVTSCRTGFSPAAIWVVGIVLQPVKQERGPSAELPAADGGHPELFQACRISGPQKPLQKELIITGSSIKRLLLQVAVNLPDSLTALKN